MTPKQELQQFINRRRRKHHHYLRINLKWRESRRMLIRSQMIMFHILSTNGTKTSTGERKGRRLWRQTSLLWRSFWIALSLFSLLFFFLSDRPTCSKGWWWAGGAFLFFIVTIVFDIFENIYLKHKELSVNSTRIVLFDISGEHF